MTHRDVTYGLAVANVSTRTIGDYVTIETCNGTAGAFSCCLGLPAGPTLRCRFGASLRAIS